MILGGLPLEGGTHSNNKCKTYLICIIRGGAGERDRRRGRGLFVDPPRDRHRHVFTDLPSLGWYLVSGPVCCLTSAAVRSSNSKLLSSPFCFASDADADATALRRRAAASREGETAAGNGMENGEISAGLALPDRRAGSQQQQREAPSIALHIYTYMSGPVYFARLDYLAGLSPVHQSTRRARTHRSV